jgi:ketosteroid isomerase-like protein
VKEMGKADKIGNAKSVTMKFVEVINAGDSKALTELQTEDFTLIDMAGDVFRGRDGWQGYFSAYPKYRIHVQHVLLSGDGVAIIGKTTGSHVPPEVEEHETVLWIAEIRDGLVAEWRIYSNIGEAKKKAQIEGQKKVNL